MPRGFEASSRAFVIACPTGWGARNYTKQELRKSRRLDSRPDRRRMLRPARGVRQERAAKKKSPLVPHPPLPCSAPPHTSWPSSRGSPPANAFAPRDPEMISEEPAWSVRQPPDSLAGDRDMPRKLVCGSSGSLLSPPISDPPSHQDAIGEAPLQSVSRSAVVARLQVSVSPASAGFPSEKTRFQNHHAKFRGRQLVMLISA